MILKILIEPYHVKVPDFVKDNLALNKGLCSSRVAYRENHYSP